MMEHQASSGFRWQPVYFGLFSIIVVATVIATYFLDLCPTCVGWLDTATAGGRYGVINATVLVSFVEVVRIAVEGAKYMVLLPADFIRSKRLQREQDQKERDEKQRDIGKGAR